MRLSDLKLPPNVQSQGAEDSWFTPYATMGRGIWQYLKLQQAIFGSVAANAFLGGPSGASGPADFRTFTSTDMPGIPSSVASQSIGASTEAVIVGAQVAVPVGKIQIGSVIRITWAMTKTAAGVAGWNSRIRIGTAGTIGDTQILASGVQTESANIDTAYCQILLNFRGPLSAACVVEGAFFFNHNLAATGFMSQQVFVAASSGTFDATVANLFISPTVITGAADAFTVTNAIAETWNL